MSHLHVHFSRRDREELVGCWCYTCSTHVTAYAWFQEWYGWTTTCCTCGDAWADGELLERPFARGWRERRVRDARRHAARLGYAGPFVERAA